MKLYPQDYEGHLWGIVLAGGDGRRLQPFIQDRFGCNRPKQYCTFFGVDSMLRRTIHRAEMLIPAARLLTVVTRPHLTYARSDLADRPHGKVIVQPSNCETGPGILLPLMHVAQRDPQAVVILFPSDHFVHETKRFMHMVEAVAQFVRRHPERLALLGVQPSYPEVDYGWIEMGTKLSQAGDQPVHSVTRFWEKPSLPQAQEFFAKGYLWNTMVLAGRAETFLTLFRQQTPDLVDIFAPLQPHLGTPSEAQILNTIYAHLPSINFSKAILTQSVSQLAVLHADRLHWSDWGDARRLQQDLRRFRLEEDIRWKHITASYTVR